MNSDNVQKSSLAPLNPDVWIVVTCNPSVCLTIFRVCTEDSLCVSVSDSLSLSVSVCLSLSLPLPPSLSLYFSDTQFLLLWLSCMVLAWHLQAYYWFCTRLSALYFSISHSLICGFLLPNHIFLCSVYIHHSRLLYPWSGKLCLFILGPGNASAWLTVKTLHDYRKLYQEWPIITLRTSS